MDELGLQIPGWGGWDAGRKPPLHRGVWKQLAYGAPTPSWDGLGTPARSEVLCSSFRGRADRWAAPSEDFWWVLAGGGVDTTSGEQLGVTRPPRLILTESGSKSTPSCQSERLRFMKIYDSESRSRFLNGCSPADHKGLLKKNVFQFEDTLHTHKCELVVFFCFFLVDCQPSESDLNDRSS